MENFLHKVRAEVLQCDGKISINFRRSFPLEADLKEVEVVSDTSSMLPSLVHSLTFEEPDVGDRDHVLERKLRRICTGLSVSSEVKLFNQVKKRWMSKRSHQERYSISRVSLLADPNFGNFVHGTIPTARDELHISAWRFYTNAH